LEIFGDDIPFKEWHLYDSVKMVIVKRWYTRNRDSSSNTRSVWLYAMHLLQWKNPTYWDRTLKRSKKKKLRWISIHQWHQFHLYGSFQDNSNHCGFT
jgi:hypothetical protein